MSRTVTSIAPCLLIALSAIVACKTSVAPPEAEPTEQSQPAAKPIEIRSNRLGYSPARSKIVFILSTEPLTDIPFAVENLKRHAVLRGKIANSLVGESKHTSYPYHYAIDLSLLHDLGAYYLKVGESNNVLASESIRVVDEPYAFLAREVLAHIRHERSGSSEARIHPASHLKDAKAPVFRPADGNIESGLWQPDAQGETVDAKGGWYDAGDYLKFTLTTAYTSYYLLAAYDISPELFEGSRGADGLPDILDEARHGLDYLAKVMPSRDTFIVQVGTSEDHSQGDRMPQDDALDGKRAALVALSAPHMGSAAAALARASVVFRKLGDETRAKLYLKQAQLMFARAQESDVSKTGAFERADSNDFYRDQDSNDNLGLAAIELYLATSHTPYRDRALSYLEKAGVGPEPSWQFLHLELNYRASTISDVAKQNFLKGITHMRNYDRDAGNIWGIPAPQGWGPFGEAFVSAGYQGLAFLAGAHPDAQLAYDHLDYVLGRNNWDRCMIALQGNDECIDAIYGQLYALTGKFPQGAIAEGPGSKAGFEPIKQWIEPSPRDAIFAPYNTKETYFSDNPGNFQTMETVTYGQATAAFFFAVVHRLEQAAKQGATTTLPAGQ